jgi:FAD binding domain
VNHIKHIVVRLKMASESPLHGSNVAFAAAHDTLLHQKGAMKVSVKSADEKEISRQNSQTSPTPSLTADENFRNQKQAFDIAVDAQGPESVIHALLDAAPDLKVYTRSSKHYGALRGVYNKLITAQPLVICRPNSASQISAVVRVSHEYSVPLGVRCGGHDVWGRGCISDSITIDMRELDTQTLAPDKQTVRIGGGVSSRNFVSFLDTHGLCTANGTAGNVGWTGWAMWGGYGPLNDYVGLGVDNIVGAKVVMENGEIVDADEELLWGIRGAGGNLGVVVETTVRVHPMPEILAGFVGYAWEEAEKVLLAYQALLDKGVPDALCGQMGFAKTKRGIGMALLFVWPDPDFEEGRKWLEVVRGFGKVVVDTVAESMLKRLFSVKFSPMPQ